ncbi:hypothetical protein [Dyadobacter bucti]|uniref:hypothetical protein n=1 Tax=Dyadobacter bucti TaxID=2572203 RepID=UPI001109C6C9|nr:hypothetical protein [Dyadobacter bucti]
MRTPKHFAGLNEIQIGLLRMFDRKIPDDEVLEIKRVLVKHLSEKLFQEVDRITLEKEISEKDYKMLESEDVRTKSKNSDE